MSNEEWAYSVLAGALRGGLPMDLADRVKALEEKVAALEQYVAERKGEVVVPPPPAPHGSK